MSSFPEHGKAAEKYASFFILDAFQVSDENSRYQLAERHWK
jgi:hypothetical protein